MHRNDEDTHEDDASTHDNKLKQLTMNVTVGLIVKIINYKTLNQ